MTDFKVEFAVLKRVHSTRYIIFQIRHLVDLDMLNISQEIKVVSERLQILLHDKIIYGRKKLSSMH